MREDGRKAETRGRRVRGEGRGAEAGRGRNNQTSVSGVWRATRVSNMEVGYWQAPPAPTPTPPTYMVRKLEKLQAGASLSTFK